MYEDDAVQIFQALALRFGLLWALEHILQQLVP